MSISEQPPLQPDPEIIPKSQEEVDSLGPTTPFNNSPATPLEQNVYETSYKLAREMVDNKHLTSKVEHDDLTGLLRKNPWLKLSNEHLEHATPDDLYAVLFIDLTNFKAVNDLHPGQHDEGDKVLKDVAAILKKDIRSGDDYEDILTRGDSKDSGPARLGGDEYADFVNLSPRASGGNTDLTPEERLAAVQERLQRDFEVYLEAHPDLVALNLGLSVGGVLAHPGQTAEELLAQSDEVMHKNKAQQHAMNGSYR